MEHLLEPKRVPPTPPSQKGNDSDQTIGYNPLMAYDRNRGTIDHRQSADNVMTLVMDLIDDVAYLPFFYKKLYAVGPARFLECARLARKIGIKKGRQFTYLLKQP